MKLLKPPPSDHAISAPKSTASAVSEHPDLGPKGQPRVVVVRKTQSPPPGDLRKAHENGSQRSNNEGAVDKRVRGTPHAANRHLEDVEPWGEPVDGASLLDTLSSVFFRYLILPSKSAADALALWVLHTYAIDLAFLSPILAITSPEKRCGKSTLLSILQAVVRRPIPASNMTPASVFRFIDKLAPTLLIDEADTFLEDNHELRGILNAGHTRSFAYVSRCVGDDHEPRLFSTWAPKVIAKIGAFSETLEDRAIVIKMRRRKKTESTDPIRIDRIYDDMSVIRRKAARWVLDHADSIRRADPEAPPDLNDRAQDNWRPLFCLADVVSERWSLRARDAALALSAFDADQDTSVAVQLLADIRIVFDDWATDRISTDDLIKSLCRMEDRPWVEIKNGARITPRVLASLLKPFDVMPRKIRVRDHPVRGYERSGFKDAFERYLPADTSESTEVPESFQIITR